MKPFSNYDKVQSISDRPKLPVDGYVCKIMDAEVKQYNGSNGEFGKLDISLDIYEGDESGFFAEDYRSQQREDKKWGCVYSLYLPADDGSEMDEFTKRKFKTFMEAVEDSNPGYHWDWNEAGLKGKIVGIIFRNEEWEWDDKHGWKVRPFVPKSADDIRKGNFKLPDDKPLKGSAVNNRSTSANTEDIIDGDLPF